MSRRLSQSQRKISRANHLELLENRRLLSAGGHGHGKHHDEVNSAVAQIVAALTGVSTGQPTRTTATLGIAADNLGETGFVTPVATTDATGATTTTDPTATPVDPTAQPATDPIAAPATDGTSPVVPDITTTPTDPSTTPAGAIDPSDQGTGGGDVSNAGEMTDTDTVTSTEGQDDTTTVVDVVDSGMPTGDDVGVIDNSGAGGGTVADAGDVTGAPTDTTVPPIDAPADSGDVVLGDSGTPATDPGVFNDGGIVTTVDTTGTSTDDGSVISTPTDTDTTTTASDTTTSQPDIFAVDVTPPPVFVAQDTTSNDVTTVTMTNVGSTSSTTSTSHSADSSIERTQQQQQVQEHQQSQQSEAIPAIAAVASAPVSQPPMVVISSDASVSAASTTSDTNKVTSVMRHADSTGTASSSASSSSAAPAAAKTASQTASANGSSTAITGPLLPPSHSADQAPAPAAPSAVPNPGDVLDAQQQSLSADALAASAAPSGGWAWLLNNGLYGRIVGGDTKNAEKPERTPRVVHRRVLVDGEAMSEFAQVDPAAAALAAQAKLASDSIDTLADTDDQIDEAGEPQRPVVVAGIVPAIESPADTTSRNILAAAFAGTAVLVVQVHQWRKKKLAAAANKLADLLQFDPLAVWLDEPTDRE